MDKDERVLEAIRTLSEKIDNLKDKMDTERKVSELALKQNSEKIDNVSRKIDDMPDRVANAIDKEIGRCKETQTLKISNIEQKITEYDGRIKSIELQYVSVSQLMYKPNPKLPDEPPYSR